MSRLQDRLQARRLDEPLRTPAEQAAITAYQERVASFQKLFHNKDFTAYLQLEEEMNDPKIVIAHKCSDVTCEALKQKIRDYWNRRKVLEKVKGLNGTAKRTRS